MNHATVTTWVVQPHAIQSTVSLVPRPSPTPFSCLHMWPLNCLQAVQMLCMQSIERTGRWPGNKA